MSRHSRKLARLRGAKTQKSIKSAFGILTFIEQITAKDRDSYSSQPTATKLQSMANNITGRIFGLNIFGSGAKFQQTINPAGMWNKWTMIGLAAQAPRLINKVSPIKIPKAGFMSSYGKVALLSGIVGGLFDAPGSSNNYSSGSIVRSDNSMLVSTESSV